MNAEPRIRVALPRVHWGWLLVLAAILAFLYGARAILGPFLAGFVIAYLLDPLTDRVQAAGVRRSLAATLTLGLFLAALTGIVLATAPVIERQVAALVETLPGVVAELRPWFEGWARRLGGDPSAALPGDIAGQAVGWITGTAIGLLEGGLAFVNIITLVVVAPIVAFYLLRDFDVLTARVDAWWPRRHAPTIRSLLAQMNEALSGFVRGQLLVCTCMAVLYAIGWSLVGIDYAAALGLFAGVMAFVPFVGPAFALLMTLLVAFGQFGLDPWMLGATVLVFAIVQAVEGSILTPNLIGNRIGLHPVWVLFAVFAGAETAGVVGIFLAVPIAAIVGVLARWLVGQYLASPLYDSGPPEPAVPPVPPLPRAD